jgi:4,5-DOPA dioxygenase extradiol
VRRGLDHGAWVPLRLMYPDADIPVAQVSLQRGGSPADHERMGRALAGLRDEGVLIVGSGSLTHNLYEFRGGAVDAPVPSWVSEFSDWMHDKLQNGQPGQLLDYRSAAPHAVHNHPSDEHLLPLFVAMGAAHDDASGRPIKAERLHSSYEYSVLAMDAYAFS